jgi:hypothetical protein
MTATWLVDTGNPASYRVEGEQGCAIGYPTPPGRDR